MRKKILAILAGATAVALVFPAGASAKGAPETADWVSCSVFQGGGRALEDVTLAVAIKEFRAEGGGLVQFTPKGTTPVVIFNTCD